MLSARTTEIIEQGKSPVEVLPLHLPEGQKVTELAVHCNECGEQVPTEKTRILHRTPVADTHVLESAGICDECRVVTTAYHRVMPDGRLQWVENGRWVQTPFLQEQPIPWWDIDRRIKRTIRKLKR
ncbi:hypothetical protein [Thioalkalivibrio sp. ALE19]|uniref:hypothetical protein n=1 Tax=Thioalkalivibrio sp. ALE19 TaxID=1266909 RepID=UPI00041F7D69|nr:hypothetical protein [Thioalkalivibrio sp. ALE19]